MEYAIIVILVLIVIPILYVVSYYNSYVNARKDGYLKYGDSGVFMWERDFWHPALETGCSIKRSELLSAIWRYRHGGREQLVQWKAYFRDNIAGRDVNEIAPLVEKEIKRRIGSLETQTAESKR